MKKLPSGSFFCCQEFTVIAYPEQAAVKFRQIILQSVPERPGFGKCEHQYPCRTASGFH